MNPLQILLICFLLTGCALLNGLEPMCQSADEVEMGESYAKNGIDVRNFDAFANQCSKYGYRVPSKVKFMESYNSNKQLMCASSVNYFKASYKYYKLGRSIDECEGFTTGNNFNSKYVKDDAFEAFQLNKSIKELDVKVNDAHLNNGKKKYGNDFFLDTLLRASYESNPASLEKKRIDRVEQLKSILKKYGLFVSDLGSI